MKTINKSIKFTSAIVLLFAMFFNVALAKDLEYVKEENGTIKFVISKIETLYSEKVPFSIEIVYSETPTLSFVPNNNIRIGKDFNIEAKDNGVKITSNKKNAQSIGTFYIFTPVFTKINAENVKGSINSNNMEVKDFAVGLSGESEFGVYNGSYKKMNVDTSGESLLNLQYINIVGDMAFSTSGKSEFKVNYITVGDKLKFSTSGKSIGNIEDADVNGDLRFETSGDSSITLNNTNVNGNIKASTSGSSQLTIQGKHPNGLDVNTSGSSIINIQ